FLLPCKDAGDVAARAVVPLRAGNRVRPRVLIGWIAGKERRDRLEVVRVIGREPPDPGETANVHRYAHGSLRWVDLHQTALLSQSANDTVNFVRGRRPRGPPTPSLAGPGTPLRSGGRACAP